MPDLPITQLPAAGAVTNTDLLAIVQAGETRRITAINFKGDTGSTGATGAVGAAGPAGSNTFLALTDTPASYVGMSGRLVTVNALENGVEFTVLQVPIDRVLLIAANGSDATGTRGRWDRPYASLNAASVASLSGDLIIVFPGTYTEANPNLTKDNVNWYFYPGVTVTSTTPAATAIFSDSLGAMTCGIFGEGIFTAAGVSSVIRLGNPATNFIFESNYTTGEQTMSVLTTGIATLKVRQRR